MIRGRTEYRLLEHTADLGFLVRADTVEELFERAAAALFDVMWDLDAVRAGPVEREISVTAPDREALLVAWLGELLSLAMAEGWVFGAFQVDRLAPESLSGRAWGEAADPARHRFRTEVKGVTYHRLLVSEDRDGWSARVFLDI